MSPRHCTPDDARHEREIADTLERVWTGYTLHPFAIHDPVDYWAERSGQMVAVVEIKQRTCTATAFADTWLPARKYWALRERAVGHGVVALYVVRFACGSVLWIDVATVDARRLRIVDQTDYGRSNGSARDCEPVIEIPVCDMTKAAGA